MSAAWWLVALVGAATIAIKGAGPVLLGGKPLPPRIGRIIGLLAPALLAALVAISTFGGDRALVLDERAVGVGAAAVAVALKAPPLLVVVVAAVVTATTRALV
ncbi:MAG TPA: AzlD domain-containing protein [Actinomycetota bacterium]|nr:AzlD domain-containing protein [Actinomycetota bacterium]